MANTCPGIDSNPAENQIGFNKSYTRETFFAYTLFPPGNLHSLKIVFKASFGLNLPV